MATLFTALGGCGQGVSAISISEAARHVLSGQKKALDWFASKTLTYRTVEPSGRLPALVSAALGVYPQMAILARMDKSATVSKAYTELALLFDQLEPMSCLFRSDGTFLAFKRDGVTWISDRVSADSDWISVASEHYGDSVRLFDQEQGQTQLNTGGAYGASF